MRHTLYPCNIWCILIGVLTLAGCSKEQENEQPVLEYGTVTDHQGNVYTTVKIGDQWWMAENLATTTFTDGTALRNISVNDSNAYWANTLEPCYTAINSGAQGLLYNGQVIRSEKSIAPEGWHVATDADWRKLEKTIGMTTTETTQTGWRGDGLAAAITSLYSIGWGSGVSLFGSNSSGFNSKPTGCRIADGRTNIFGNTAFWWTSTLVGDDIYYRYIDANQQDIFRQTENYRYGMSIRCVKN